MNVIAAFLSAFFYVVFTQNLVFTGGYGTSEVIRSAARCCRETSGSGLY